MSYPPRVINTLASLRESARPKQLELPLEMPEKDVTKLLKSDIVEKLKDR